MQEVRAAVIGTGVMGRKYAQMIAEGKAGALRLTAVVCRSAGAQQWAKDTLPDTVRVCPSADQLYDYAEEFDAVLVVTPHKTHPALVMQAFAHGKHVLCDKPSANALAPALEMNRVAEKSGLVFAMMFHQRRYKKYIKLKNLLDDGALGEIKRVQLENSRYFRTWMYHRSGSWRSSWAGEGGGALLNQGQHILDMYQYLFGMPQKLFAAIPFGKYNDFIVDDEATIVMEYDNGKTGTFILSTGEACHEERLEIIGTKARILLEDDTLTITRHRDVCEYIKNEEVNSRQNMTFAEETIQFEKASEPYAQLFENFANAVLKGDESYLTVKGSEGINSLMLCASAYYSACKGIKVELPLEASDYKELMDELIKKEEGE